MMAVLFFRIISYEQQKAGQSEQSKNTMRGCHMLGR